MGLHSLILVLFVQVDKFYATKIPSLSSYALFTNMLTIYFLSI